jgi:osmotically-inducible protein OsmY
MTTMKKPRWPFFLGGIVGAAAVYYLDPDKGSQRRDSLGPVTQKMGGAGSFASRAVSTVKETVPHTPDNPNPDDTTLRDRVESEIFRNPQTSREHINVNVVGGIVELRGEQATQGDIDRLVQAVKGIPNVKGVHNYLHLPGTPAPNKESAIEAS